MPSVTINLDEELLKNIRKRAKKNFFTVKEQIEDIVRRSMVSYKHEAKSRFKADDRLIEIFSREKRGRKTKK